MEIKINELPELTDSSGSHIVGYKGNDTVQIPTDAVVSKAQEIISDAYSATKAYTIGEYCIYNNSLYKCIANTSAGITPTNSTYWANTSVSGELAGLVSAINHRNVYRGKNLGSSVTAAQKAAIQAGTFDDLFIGDYWVINGVTWRIAHFDYWLNTGDTNCTTHHVVIVPDTNLYSAQMNTENITTGGYHGSVMYTTNLANAKTTINNAFGSSHILSHRELLTNAVSNGNASGWAWYDSTVELMSEVMVYGGLAWSVGGKGYEVGIDKEQLALFRLDHSRICNRALWWLRGVNSATHFALVASTGDAYLNGASNSLGVRPAFAIK